MVVLLPLLIDLYQLRESLVLTPAAQVSPFRGVGDGGLLAVQRLTMSVVLRPFKAVAQHAVGGVPWSGDARPERGGSHAQARGEGEADWGERGGVAQ